MVRSYLSRLVRWSKFPLNTSILNAFFTIGSLGLVVKLIYTGKDVLVANQFGTSPELDAYVLTFALLSFVINMFLGSFESAFIPTYIETRDKQGKEAAQELVAVLLGRTTLILGGLLVVLLAASPALLRLLGAGFDQPTISYANTLLLLMLPTLLLSGLIIVANAALNAEQHFSPVALAPGAIPLATIVFIELTAKSWGVYSLVAGLLMGTALQAGALILILKRYHFSVRFRWRGALPMADFIFKQVLLIMGGTFLMSASELIDKAMATPLGPGSVSALNYGYKVVALILNVSAVALGTAIFPHLARMVTAKNWHGIGRMLRNYGVLILAASIPLMLVLILFSEPLIRVLFQRGAFTAEDTQRVSQIQSMYLLLLPVYLISTLVVRLLSSLKANYVFVPGAVINVIVNVTLNYIFIQWFGVAGIALSTVGVYLISLSYLSVMLWRQLAKVREASA